MRRSCDAGDAKGCAKLAATGTAIDGASKEVAKAAADKSCAAGYAEGCSQVGVLSIGDSGRAAEFFRKGCEGRDAKVGCFNLAYAYEVGSGVPKDPAKAAELYKRACDAGSQIACKFVKGPAKKSKR